MKLIDYINKINSKVMRINAFISNPFNYRNIKTPFYITKSKTYVWIDNDNKVDI